MDLRAKPFDVDLAFANASQVKKKQTKKFRGPDAPLYSSIYPLVYIVKIFGLAPYEFSKDQLVPSRILIIFSFVFAGIYTYVVYTIVARFTGLKRDRPVLGATETAKVLSNYFVAVYDIAMTVFTRSTFVRIWNALQDYDETVRQLGYPRKETRTIVASWLFFLLQTITWLAVNRMGMYAFLEAWTNNMSYMCVYVGTSVSVYKFVGVTFFLGQRFQQLNEIATKNLPPRSGYRISSDVSKETVRNLHNELMVAGETLSSLYSWSLIFWLGNLSMHTVSNLYFVIDWVLLTSWSDVAWPLIFCLLTWLVAFLTQLLMLHVVCDYASDQANSMGSILVEWNVRLIKRLPKDEIVETSLHLINRRLRFSAAGCFFVNLPLLRSIAALLTTYLVILLQLPE